MVKEKNIELVRTVLTELDARADILQGTPVDVHAIYAEEDPNLEGNFLDMGGWVTQHECGTAACAAGWLAQDPRIQAAGLTLDQSLDHPNQLTPVYGTYRGMDALQVFLGFQHSQNVLHVFGGDNPDSFSAVLEHLDQAAQAEREWAKRRRRTHEQHSLPGLRHWPGT